MSSVKQQIADVFRRWDSEKSGTISRLLLVQILSETIIPEDVLCTGQLQAFLGGFDSQDGHEGHEQVDYQDFLDQLFCHSELVVEPSQGYMELVKAVEAQASPELAQALLQEHRRALGKADELNALLKQEVQELRRKLAAGTSSETLSDRRQFVATRLSTAKPLSQRFVEVEGAAARVWSQKTTDWEEGDVTPAIWHLTQSDRTHKGGGIHTEFEEEADRNRSANDSINKQAAEIKSRLK
ncbi:unnamed protein product, partial [Polarella glacialis]